MDPYRENATVSNVSPQITVSEMAQRICDRYSTMLNMPTDVRVRLDIKKLDDGQYMFLARLLADDKLLSSYRSDKSLSDAIILLAHNLGVEL